MILASSPLIFLSKIDKLSLLNRLFKTLIIPQEVVDETIIEGKEGYEEIKKIIEKKQITVVNPKEKIDFGLGNGENAAISLAKEKKDSLIIDDARAIRLAKSLNIEYIRTITIILNAVHKGLIKKEEAMQLINKLISAGYYITPKIYSEIMQVLNQSK